MEKERGVSMLLDAIKDLTASDIKSLTAIAKVWGKRRRKEKMESGHFSSITESSLAKEYAASSSPIFFSSEISRK